MTTNFISHWIRPFLPKRLPMSRRSAGRSCLRTNRLDERIAPAVSVFQQGVDFGFGAFTGTVDTQLKQVTPDQSYGSDPDPVLVDFDNTVASNALLRFNDIIGNGPGQIPAGATILNAVLTVNTTNPGDGGSFHRMLIDWQESLTWNQAGSGTGGYNISGGIQADNVEAKMTFVSQTGNAAGSMDIGAGRGDIRVTADVQAWVNGESNFGWAMLGWNTLTDGWEFDPAEAAIPANRPKLAVEWVMPADLATTFIPVTFQHNVGGYTGTQDVRLRQTAPAENDNATTTIQIDFNDGANNEVQSLLRFDNIIGSGVGQVPFGAKVQKAILNLTSTDVGDGATLHRMLVTWPESSNWNSTGSGTGGFNSTPGIQADNVEAVATFNNRAGSPLLTPNYAVWSAPIDVTLDVQAWADGEANHGWALLPWLAGTDAVSFGSSENATAGNRPRLQIWYAPIATPTPIVTNSLDVTAGKLTYLGGNVLSNNVNVSVAAGTYTITDSSPITLSANAITAGWMISGNSAFGPESSVSNLLVNTLDGPDSITVASVNHSITLRGGDMATDQLTFPSSLSIPGGTIDAAGFKTITTGIGVKLTAATVSLTADGIGTSVNPILTAASTLSGIGGNAGTYFIEDDGAIVTALRASGGGEMKLTNLSGALNIPNDIGTFIGPIEIISDDGINLNGMIASLYLATITVRVNTDGAGSEGLVMGYYGGMATGNTSQIYVEVNTAAGGTGPAIVGNIFTSVTGSSILVDAHAGAITNALSGNFAIATGTTGTVEFRGQGVGASGNPMPVVAQSVIATSQTGGVFISDNGAQPTIFVVSTVSGDIDLFSIPAVNNGIIIAAPMTTAAGNITIRADDSLLVNAAIGGGGFSGTVLLVSNLDGGNEQVIQTGPGASIITTNATAKAIQLITYPATTATAIGGIVVSDDIICGDGGTITLNAAGLLGDTTDATRAGAIVLGFGTVGGSGTDVEITAGPTGAVNMTAKDNPIGLPTTPLYVNAGTVTALTNSTTSTINASQIASDVFLTSDMIVNLAATTTTAGLRVGNISVLTTVGPLNLIGDVKVDDGTITLNTPGGILQTAGVVFTTGKLDLTYTGTATFTTAGNSAPTLAVANGRSVIVDGSFTPTTAVTVDGILKGKGSVGAVTVSATGEVAPGTSPGKLSTGNFAMTLGSKFTVELNGTGAGTGYDQLDVTGTVNLSNATLSASLGFIPPGGSKYVIVNNDGSDTISTTFNGIADGSKVNIGGTDFTINYNGGDGNDIELQAPGMASPPPTVTAPVAINGGNQRSMVQSITITFSEPVALATGAFKVEGTALGPIGDVGLLIMQAGNVVTLTFDTTGVPIDPAGSLRDGKYRLTMFADKITGVGGKLDGNKNGISQGSPTDDVTFNFHRLFGDGNGDGGVNSLDFALFRGVFGLAGPSIFDFNGDNNTNNADFAQFRGRFGLGGYAP